MTCGSIIAIASHPTLPYVASMGMDRNVGIWRRSGEGNLDRLFEALKVAPDNDSAKYIENRIWSAWIATDSDTCTLLMSPVKTAVDSKDIDLGIKLLTAVIQIKPDYLEALEQLGHVLLQQARWDAARPVFEQLLAMQPDHAEAFACLVRIRELLCDWRTRAADFDRLRRDTEERLAAGKRPAVTPFNTMTLPWPLSLRLAVARSFSDHLVTGVASLRQSLNFEHPRSRSGRLRIGTPGLQTAAFVAGIDGVAIPGPVRTVVINASGQLGTAAAAGAARSAGGDDGRLDALLARLDRQEAKLRRQQREIDALRAAR